MEHRYAYRFLVLSTGQARMPTLPKARNLREGCRYLNAGLNGGRYRPVLA